MVPPYTIPYYRRHQFLLQKGDLGCLNVEYVAQLLLEHRLRMHAVAHTLKYLKKVN